MSIETKADIASIPTPKEHESIEVRVNELNNKGKIGYRIDVRKFVKAREEGAFEGFTREGFSLTREAAALLRDAIDEAIAEADSLAALVTEQPAPKAPKPAPAKRGSTAAAKKAAPTRRK